MSVRISLTDHSEISDSSKMCAVNANDNQVGADRNKKIAKRAEKHGLNSSSACYNDFVKKLFQVDLCSGNNASPQENNQVKESGKGRIEDLSPKQKIYVASKKVIYGIEQIV